MHFAKHIFSGTGLAVLSLSVLMTLGFTGIASAL